MGDIDDVQFAPGAVVFHGYPFPGARVYPSGEVAWSEVVEVDLEAAPPEVRVRGETLFVSAMRKDELRRAAAEHGVPDVPRVDVWDLLLEPFIDTVFDADDQERTLARLEQNGISRDEAEAVRATVREPMLAYNSMLWDWVHLGMYDLLSAHLHLRTEVSEAAFAEFYRWAQQFAQRAGINEWVVARRAAQSAGAAGDASR
ncbi:MAG TPA: hypothetical protein VFS20_09010 [Longimicrobium sp.]|nr:hypothetical protein [Longimicrobium sp.]